MAASAVPSAAVWAALPPSRSVRWGVGLFFVLLLAAGWWLAPGYGSFTDEPSCRESGQISLTYLYECVPARWLPARAAARLAALPPWSHLAQYNDRDYGVAFELPMTLLEKASGYTDMGQVLVLRHRCVWATCWLGCLAFFWLATQRFGSWRVGLLAILLLLASPRLFADFFYNAKDAVFLACFTVAMATLVAFVQQPSLRRAAWHALACAVAIDVRLMGILLPAATVGLLGWRAAQGAYAGRYVGWLAITYAGLLVLLVVALWPYLWVAPWPHFRDALLAMSYFQRWGGHTLYRGVLLPGGAQLPWHYALVWIGITTPLLYLGGLGISLGLLGRQLGRRGGWRLATQPEWLDALSWGWLLGPLLVVAVLHSRLYDGWRQLYFVYPALLLLAMRGLLAAWHWQPAGPRARPYWRGLVAIVVAGALSHTCREMVQLHPLQNLYFNALAGLHPELRYEYDYWGLSLRQGLAQVAALPQAQPVRVRTNAPNTLVYSAYLLPPAAQARLRIERSTGPVDYFITTYRYHPQPYPFGAPVCSLRTQPTGGRVLDVFYFGPQLTPPPNYWRESAGRRRVGPRSLLAAH